MPRYTLTEEHRAQLDEWAKKWIGNALRTGPYTDADLRRTRQAMRGMYRAAKLEPPPPHREIFADGPISGAIAAGVAAGVWWLREHPEGHAPLFGRLVSEATLMASIAPACALAVSHGMQALTGDLVGMEVPMVPVAATSFATRATTEKAVRAATRVATRAVTRIATRAVTETATRAASEDATRAAIEAATRAATDAPTRAATRAATVGAIRAATEAAYIAIAGATRATMINIPTAATNATTRAAIDAAIQTAIDATTRAATRAATDSTTRTANDSTTRAANDSTTRAANDSTTRAANDTWTDATSHAATEQPPSAVVCFLVLCTDEWANLSEGGNQSSGWTAVLSFFRHIAKLPLDYTRWRHYEAAAKVGPRYMHDRFWIVCALPEHLRLDERNRPHRTTGPSCSWPDGFALWHWHGIRVPRAWIDDPKQVDPLLALTWTNVEQRRVLAEIVGWTRVLEQLHSRVIDEDPDPEIGTLLEVDLPGVGKQRFLQVRCATGRTFALPMPPEIETARAGQAWSYGISESEHRKLAFRT